MIDTAKYRLYPTAEQRTILAKTFGCGRWVYNYGLGLKKEAWELRQEHVSSAYISALLPVLKAQEETQWLSEAPSQALQQVVRHLDSAFKNFIAGRARFPKFKSKYGRQSFVQPQGSSLGENSVLISKIGKVKAVISKIPAGKVKSVTVSRTPTGKYFASVLFETPGAPPVKVPTTPAGAVGIDLGLTDFAVLSDGRRVANPRHLQKKLRRLKRAQRIHSRRKLLSSNRNKARHRVAVLHEKVANQRKDFLHKLSTSIIHDNQVDTVCSEDLAVQNMQKNRRLACSISSAGWYTFRRMLAYKAERMGKNLLVIDRFLPSSKTCSCCGTVKDRLSLAERQWTCQCGAEHDRDVNAAINIKQFALNSVRPGRPEFTLGESACRQASVEDGLPAFENQELAVFTGS